MSKKWAVALVVLIAGAAQAQSRVIRGTVADVATGEPVPGATIKVVGTDLSASTGADGSFSVSGAPTASIELTLAGSGFRAARAPLRAAPPHAHPALQRALAQQ